MNWKKIFRKKRKELPFIKPKSFRPQFWTPKVYILQKDLPNMGKGMRFQQSYQSDNIYFHGIPISSMTPEKDQVGIIEFEACDVENNTEWFLPYKIGENE